MNTLMNKHIRKITGLPAKSSVAALYDEITLPDWDSLRKIRKLRLCGKMMNLPCNTITKQLFEYEITHLGTSYWTKGSKATMSDIILENWWHDGEIKTNKKNGRMVLLLETSDNQTKGILIYKMKYKWPPGIRVRLLRRSVTSEQLATKFEL